MPARHRYKSAMAASIPFDHPSLLLGHVVNTDLLALLEKIAGLQAKTDAAFDKMNSFVAMRRGLSMTMNELVSLSVDITELKTKIAELNRSISDAARDYMNTRIANDTSILEVRGEISALENITGTESPLDFKHTDIKRISLGADSMKLDVQYFSYGTNDDSASATIAAIESAVGESNADMGAKARELAKTASAQITQQLKHHNIAGTLLISANCTHRASAILEPVVLNVERAVDVWNNLHAADPNAALHPTDLAAMRAIAETVPSAADKSMTLLIGARYGSSFVGMVHMVQNEMSGTGLGVEQEEAMQEQMRLGGWLQAASGGVGVDESVVETVRKLLSTQSVNTHANMIVMGVVPSVGSAHLQLGVAKLLEEVKADPDPGVLDSEKTTFHSAANAAAAGARRLAMRGGMMQNLIQGLGKIDQGANKVIDLNTLMNSFDNYLEEVHKEESSGMPVSFMFRKITRAQLARMWLDKYYAEQKAEAASGKSTQ